MNELADQLPGQIDILSSADPGEFDDLFLLPADEYKEFLSKFERKKTTDDCYTPPAIYDVIADWVAKEYGLDRKNFVRPFYPGGDYERERYGSEDIVVDNPPFSIIAKIIRFFCKRNIPFFLFAPALTVFTAPECPVCYLTTGVSITYENGAKVATSFCTSLDPAQIRTAPDLRAAVERANIENRATTPLPKYTYPSEVITAAAAQRLSQFGIDFSCPRGQAVYVATLDAQRSKNKTIFGGGFLLAERAAAELAAAINVTWELSDREMQIVKSLNKEEKTHA